MLASDYLTLADLADRWGVTADSAHIGSGRSSASARTKRVWQA